MKRNRIWAIALLLLPMPFYWYGYGEKGYVGFVVIESGFFAIGWLLLLFSYVFRNRWNVCLKGLGSVVVLFSYFWGAWDFCGHISGTLNPLTVCKLPMWISFLGAVGIIIDVCFLANQNKKAELE